MVAGERGGREGGRVGGRESELREKRRKGLEREGKEVVAGERRWEGRTEGMAK